jgi:hypothetical protein
MSHCIFGTYVYETCIASFFVTLDMSVEVVPGQR